MNTEYLFVDDDRDILAGFQRLLRKDCRIDTALGGEQALTLLRSRGPYAVIVADMQMPGMNGVELLTQVEKISPDTVRIMLTGNADQKTAVNAVNQGHIFRFLSKPCPMEELLPALRAALKQHHLVTAEREILEKTLNGSTKILSDILATHDPFSFGEGQSLRAYMKAFADHLQLKQTWDLELAAMLSQIGCVTIPQPVLERARSGAMLSPPELDMIARVPQIGFNLLSNIPRLESVAAIILYQKKNFDGSGFPADAVAGADIPIGSRILRVLNDLLSHESDKASKSKALEAMTRCPGRYDPKVLEAVAAGFDICLGPVVPVGVPIRSVRVKEVRVGNILAADVRTCDGALIAPAGTQISPMLIEKLRNFSELDEIDEPLSIAR